MVKSVPNELAYRINKPRRVLFDHLPKCAGSTITEYLEMHYPRRFVFKTNGWPPSESVKAFQSLPEGSRHRYHLVTGHLTHELLDYVHPDTITFTIFREPVDRIVSHYFFVKQDKQHHLHDRVMKSSIQLEDYASSGLSPELRNWYTTHFTGLSIEEVEMEPGESVRRAAQVISERYDIVGFQDDLPAVMHNLSYAAHLYKPFDNQVRNKTIKRIGLGEVPENVRKAIAEVNFLDVKLYALLKARGG